jgi:hypothetical protein
MKRMMQSAIVAVVLLLSSLPAAQETKPAPQDVSYCQLAATPKAFAGKTIRVRAIYRYMFEVSLLASPECCAQPELRVWVTIDMDLDRRSERVFKKFPPAGAVLATFEGDFEAGGAYGTFATPYQLHVTRILNLESKSRTSPTSPKPKWFPKGCKTN